MVSITGTHVIQQLGGKHAFLHLHFHTYGMACFGFQCHVRCRALHCVLQQLQCNSATVQQWCMYAGGNEAGGCYQNATDGNIWTYFQPEDSCFQYVQEPKTWDEARKRHQNHTSNII